MTGMDHKYDVFLSHVGLETGDFVESIHELLHGMHLEVFWDKRSLLGSADTASDMDAAASKAPVGVVILSRSSFIRNWPVREMWLMSRANNALAPVLFNVEYSELKNQFIVPPQTAKENPDARKVNDDWPLVAKRICGPQMVIKELNENHNRFKHRVALAAILQCCAINEQQRVRVDLGNGAKEFLERTLRAANAVRDGRNLLRLDHWMVVELNRKIPVLMQIAADRDVARILQDHWPPDEEHRSQLSRL